MASTNSDSWARDHVADANPELPRKRERLSEEKDDASPMADNGVVVEALPLEEDDAGSSYENAIELHDEAPMPAFYEDFDLQPGCGVAPINQLNHIAGNMQQGISFECRHIDNLCQWVHAHTCMTSQLQDRWRSAYMDEEREFFERLGQVCRDLLSYGVDWFVTKHIFDHGVDQLRTSLNDFLPAITELSTRILRYLPDAVDNMAARRDSGQVPKTRQPLDLLFYVEILARSLALHRANSSEYLKDTFNQKPRGLAGQRRAVFHQNPANVLTLLGLLQKLVQNHRIISNSWDGIDALLQILKALSPTDTEQLQVIMSLIHHGIMPLICEKHPRALPEGFHENIVSMAVEVLEQLFSSADDETAATLYQRYIKSEHDALIDQKDDATVAAQLQEVSSGNRTSLVELMKTSWSLQALRSFIYSDIMDVRTCGILLLSQRFLKLFNDHRGTKEAFDHPVLQYVARFMRANELTKYIFGPNSHASLVCHSGNIIGFLAATMAYTHLETDIIWHACINSVEVEFAKAALGVLSDICRYLDLEQLLYVANKYVDTPPAKLGNDAVDSLTDLFQKVQLKSGASEDQDHRLATAFISIDVMMKADASEHNNSLSRLRDTAKEELRRFTAADYYPPEDRLEIYGKCTPHITKPSEHATTAIDILVLFLRGSFNLEEGRELLNLLPMRAVVDELGRFLETRRSSTSTFDKDDIAAIRMRLELIVRLLALPDVDFSSEDLEPLFKCTVGEKALNNEARDAAWGALISMVKTGGLSGVASNLLQRFLAEDIAALPLDFVTPQLITIFGTHLQQQLASSETQSDLSSILSAPIWQKLVQAAESVDNPGVSQQAAQMICRVLFGSPGQKQASSSAMQCHAEFARQQIGRICKEFQGSTNLNTGSICQKLGLLDAVLSQSREAAGSSETGSNPEIVLATEPEDELLRYTLQIHGTGHTQPKTFALRAKSSNLLSELAAKLPDATGATENRVIVGGREIDLKSEGETTFADIGVPASGVIPICPKHTSESDLGLVLTSPGAVENEVLEQYGELEMLLDGPTNIASQAYVFLTKVRPPIRTRHHVASPETEVRDLCPLNKPWRCAFSFHVLRTNLTDFARIGVADESFILQGLRLALEVITDPERSIQPDVMIWALDCLVAFLLEQPQKSTTTDPIEEPALFTARMIELCIFALRLPSPDSNGAQRFNLASLALKALLQGFRRQKSVWHSFSSDAGAAEVFKQAIFHSEVAFAQLAAGTILTCCTDDDSAGESADFYMQTLLGLLSQARTRKDRAKLYFELVTQVLLSNETLRSDEARAREITKSLVESIWEHDHAESVDLPIADLAMTGLLKLLTEAVNVLKSFKKPLDFGNFSTKLFNTLLFPPCRDPSSRPLVNQASRKLGMELVKATCESHEEFDGLLDGALGALSHAHDNPSQLYPGRLTWLRPATLCSGLPNLGMTCYMNSLLQQLFANVQFRKFLLEVPILDVNKQALVHQVQLLFANMQDFYNIPPATGDLARVLNIQTDSQEDVHGFYEELLSRLESNMPDAGWKAGLAKFFTGKLISQIKGECGHVSPKEEPFVDLPVNVKNKASLSESLHEFVQGEPMEGANKYKCLACDTADGGRLVNAMRRTCPDEMPDNLTFCLKRFTFEAMFGMEGKVNDRFEFPQAIDISQYQRARLESSETPLGEDLFELVGVIVHQGTLNLGHYWSYTLLRNTARPDIRQWVKLEDKNVTLVDGGVEAVQQECFGGRWNNGHERADNAYVLFYQRRTSLEKQVALPGPVIDPETGILLPPKVAVEPEMKRCIHNNNDWAQRIAQLFDDDFASFIEWLISKYTKSELVSPVDSVLEPSDDDKSTMADSPKDSTVEGEVARKIDKVVMAYIKRVAVCHSTPVTRLKRCINSLEPLLTGPGQHPLYLLEEIANDASWYSALIKHDNRMVRNWINTLIIKCSAQILEQDPIAHDAVFRKLRQTHSGWIANANDPQIFDWSSYLKLVTHFAGLGPQQTAMVLEEYYWSWVFEILSVPFDPQTRKKYTGLWDHMKHNSANVAALYQFIYDILNGHVDISDFDNRSNEEGPRRFSQRGVLLRYSEFMDLVQTGTEGYGGNGIAWLLRGAKLADKGGDWKGSAPGRLLGLLVSEKADPRLREHMKGFLLHHIDIEEDNLNSIMHLVIHFYANWENPDHAGAAAVLKALVKVVPMWTGSELEFTNAVREVYRYAPCTVLSTQELWVHRHLINKSTAAREATAKWLIEDVYGQSPLSERSDLDLMRVSMARKMVSEYGLVVIEAMDKYRTKLKYDPMIEVILQIEKYLKKLLELAQKNEADISASMQLELNELQGTLDKIAALDNDVFCMWNPDNGVAVQGSALETGGASTSLADDEEMESDDDWDASDDGDSIIETVTR